MKSKILYGLLLSSIFMSIDALSKTHTNKKTGGSTTVESSTGRGGSNNVDTFTTENITLIHANKTGGSTTMSKNTSSDITGSYNLLTHTNKMGGSTEANSSSVYASNGQGTVGSIVHTNKAGGSTTVGGSTATGSVGSNTIYAIHENIADGSTEILKTPLSSQVAHRNPDGTTTSTTNTQTDTTSNPS